MKTQNGFTIFEVLLVIGLFSVLTLTSLLLFGNLLPSTDLAESIFLLKQEIRKTRELSVQGYNNSNHGVFIDAVNKQIVSYQGQSYVSRNASADSAIKFNPALIFFSSFTQSDLNFAKWTGIPSATGTIILQHPSAGQGEIMVNALGVVNSK